MSWKEKTKAIRERYGAEFMLRMLAEECSELSQACLKVIRARRRETPVEPSVARGQLIDELADVMNMWEAVVAMLDDNEAAYLKGHMRFKQFRMWDRMMDGGDEDGEEHDG